MVPGPFGHHWSLGQRVREVGIDEIQQAFKREAAKAHPDRQPADQKDKAHKRFVELGTARDWLLERARKDAA